MSLDYNTPEGIIPGNCTSIVNKLVGKVIVPKEYSETLFYICSIVDASLLQDKFSEPMVWIGIYIAAASLLCILAMTADLLHGFRNKKLWFPCKYFSLNAASITVITVAMKLPVDLSSEMPSYMDQATKLGSLAFMCTMMVNLMPSLASMDNRTLPANVIGLSILVITVIVNVYIQVNTGVISPTKLCSLNYFSSTFDCAIIAYIYMAISLVLLIIIISFSLIIPTSKEILEFKYQAINKASLTDQQPQHIRVEKLKQYVRKYLVMAETGSPQFVMATNPLSAASAVISVLVLFMNLPVVFNILSEGHEDSPGPYGSPYKRSILAIVITQFIGVIVGTISPILRCFSLSNFNLFTESSRNHFMFFNVELYWTQTLREWKQSHIPFLLGSHRSRALFYNSKNTILSLCIGFQKVIVVSCKMIWMLTTSIIITEVFCLNCLTSLKEKLFTPPIASGTNNVNEDLSEFILQIHNEMELSKETLKGISNSINFLILKAEKEQNSHLLELLLERSTGLKGVGSFDTDHVQPLLPVELVNSWSLPVVTLTCIALALPNIRKDSIKFLLRSVGEGLLYAHHVEESLNRASEYVYNRKATMTIWHEVENNGKWLDNTLSKKAFKGRTPTEILHWFADKAKEIVIEIKESVNREMMENNPMELIAANSMYRITQTILLRDESKIEPISEEQLFSLLYGMIADILCACFTNIPRVITMKCHESVIEKRESSVKFAAKLLGKTTKIIKRLEICEVPSMDHDKMAYIDEWRLYLKQSIP